MTLKPDPAGLGRDHEAVAVPVTPPAVAGRLPVVSAPSGWSDVLTGTDGPRYWDRVVLSERARAGRYKRPVTVAFVELAGLDDLGRRWGADVAERTLAAVARTLARQIRSSDHIAHVEAGRLGILLTETDEIAAINFVERARGACDRSLPSAVDRVAVCFGWASPPKGGDLNDAISVALDRLASEMRKAR
jgi:diguanylate cyclase (GGDEF)-like protein